MRLTPDNAQEITPKPRVLQEQQMDYLDTTQGFKRRQGIHYTPPSAREQRRWEERQKRGKRERVKVKSMGFG